MKILPQTWQEFKFLIGLAIVTSAVFYGILVTVLILAFGEQVCDSAIVWNFLTTIISTALGWFLAKASTVIDYIYGTSSTKSPPNGGSRNEPQLPKRNFNSIGSSDLPEPNVLFRDTDRSEAGSGEPKTAGVQKPSVNE